MTTRPNDSVSSPRKHPLLRKIAPGIRLKLSIFTGLFITLVLITATVFHYLHQSQILEDGFEKEVEPSLRYLNSVVIDMENVKRNLILIEEMKLRIKDKKRDLGKYRKTVLRRVDSFSNRLKRLGHSLGMKVKYDYSRRQVDTYYSVYLSDGEISGLENEIKSQLKYRNGQPIADRDFRKIQSAARDAASYQRSHRPKTESPGNARSVRMNPREARLNRMLRDYYDYYLQRIDQMGLHGSPVRILSRSLNGSLNYDTGSYIRESRMRFNPLMESAEYRRNSKLFFAALENAPGPDVKQGNDYRIGESLFLVEYTPFYHDPATFERLKKIAGEIREHPSRWKDVLEADLELTGPIAETAGKLRVRSALLRKKMVVPSGDREYRELYREYRALLKKRETAFIRLSPYRDELKNSLARLRSEIEKEKAEREETEKALAGLHPDTDGNRSEALKARLEALKKRISELGEDMENARKDLSLSGKRVADDAFRRLRDAALYDYIQLKYREDPSIHNDYLKSARYRGMERSRWAAVRNWIIEGDSETGLPETVPGHRSEKTLPNGILTRSRSEAEEYMWRLDGTPLISEVGIFGYDIDEEGLTGFLMRNSIAGYNTVLIDKTDGARKIARNGWIMLGYSLPVALLSVFLAWVLSGFMVRRVKGIIEQAGRARDGDLGAEFPEKGLDEIEALGNSLNAMVAGLRERERMKGEIAAAGEIQKRLLPETIPNILREHYEIGTFYRPMQGVGGDYYDFIELDEGGMVFCIGDVSSHGVGPALVMATVRTQLHGIIRRGDRNLAKILLEINDSLFFETPPHIFVTFFIGILERGSNLMRYCSAGHLRPVIYRRGKKGLEIPEGGGLPLGMDDNDLFSETIEEKTLAFEKGDIFFQYTDGVSEAMNGARTLYGEDRLYAELTASAGKNPEEIVHAIARSVESHTGKQLFGSGPTELNDDLAMLAIKRL